jgi:hypothetical protein
VTAYGKSDDGGGSFLSLSIDISGSTKTKQAIVENSGDNDQYRTELYDSYLRLLFNVEATLYEMVHAGADLDLAKLFLVKTIGDEFWYVYEVNRRNEVALRRIRGKVFILHVDPW